MAVCKRSLVPSPPLTQKARKGLAKTAQGPCRWGMQTLGVR